MLSSTDWSAPMPRRRNVLGGYPDATGAVEAMYGHDASAEADARRSLGPLRNRAGFIGAVALIAGGVYDGWARGVTPFAGILVFCGLALLWAWRVETKRPRKQ
jgi:hypothetical protein